MDHQQRVTDGGVVNAAFGLQVGAFERWVHRSRVAANHGVDPERFYTPEELSTLNQRQRRTYFEAWTWLCSLAVGERQRARGYDPTDVKPGGPAPDQQGVEERIAIEKGRAGRPQRGYPNQSSAAGSSTGYYTTTRVGNFANWSGSSRNNFIPPPRGNRAIVIKNPAPIAPSRDVVQTSSESARGPETVRPSAPVQQAPDFSGSEVYSAIRKGKMKSSDARPSEVCSANGTGKMKIPDARPKSWPTDNSDKPLTGYKKMLAASGVDIPAMKKELDALVPKAIKIEEFELAVAEARNQFRPIGNGDCGFAPNATAGVDTANEQASKHSPFLESWPIRRNATAVPLVPHGRSVFEGLLYGPEVRNPHPRQLYLVDDIHTPECPEAIKKAAAECKELAWWGVPHTETLNVLLAE